MALQLCTIYFIMKRVKVDGFLGDVTNPNKKAAAHLIGWQSKLIL